MPVVAFAKTERSTPRDHTSTKISFEVTTQSTISPLDGWVICLKDLETFAVLLFSFYVAYPEDQPKFYLGNNDSIQHESTEKILMQSMLPILAKFKNVPIPQAVNDHIDAVVDQFDFLWNMPYLSCSECLEQAQEIRDAGKEAFDAGDFKLGLERYHAAYFRMYVTADDDVFETRIPQHFAQILEGGVYDDQRGDVVRRELSMQLNLDILKAHLGMQDPETAYHWGMLLIASLEDSDADLHQRLPAGVDETIGFEISDAYLEIADACFYVFEDKQAEKYFGYGLDYLSGRPNFVEEMDRRFQVIHVRPVPRG
ncbi:hypothetical protein MMC12_000596 [Toensbergia leucococca]|nr:hypothetical protein [Toensbergia leucococca]